MVALISDLFDSASMPWQIAIPIGIFLELERSGCRAGWIRIHLSRLVGTWMRSVVVVIPVDAFVAGDSSGTWTASFFKMALISDGDNVGSCCSSNAMMPVAMGAACDVPLNTAVLSSA